MQQQAHARAIVACFTTGFLGALSTVSTFVTEVCLLTNLLLILCNTAPSCLLASTSSCDDTCVLEC